MAFVKLLNLTIQYQNFDATIKAPFVINQLTALFKSGTFTLLTGQSGSGKTTLLKTIAGIYSNFGGIKVSGIVSIGGNLGNYSKVSMMFQNPNMQFSMDTVERELRFSLENLQISAAKIENKIQFALDYIGVSKLRYRKIDSLSGGEKQGVALATIVAMDSDVILLDEPFASIDPVTRQQLLDKLHQLNRKKHKTVIITDHDLLNYEPYISTLAQLSDDGKQIYFFNHFSAHRVFTSFMKSANLNVTVAQPKSTELAAVTLTQVSIIKYDRQLLKPTSFFFPKHRVILLTGVNGSGKSTLLRAISHLSQYTGTISIVGMSTTIFRKNQWYKQVSMVFQNADDQFLNVTVEEEISLSLKHSQQSEYFQSRLTDDLINLELIDFRDHVVYSLSGGQKKKLQILIMLIMATPILLLDEPFTGLDLHSLNVVVTMVKDVQQALGLTIIMISHLSQGLAPFIDYHAVLANQTLTYVDTI